MYFLFCKKIQNSEEKNVRALTSHHMLFARKVRNSGHLYILREL